MDVIASFGGPSKTTEFADPRGTEEQHGATAPRRTGLGIVHFYVDESGNSGSNVFDEAQPILYYGVLSSTLNIEALAAERVRAMRRKLGVDHLHASELGMGRLATIGNDLAELQKRLDLRFDFYHLKKVDYAYVQFFDQVFDQGLNKAVPWTSYWSPLRYLLLVRLAALFDEPLLREAWKARTTLDAKMAADALVAVCRALRERVPAMNDERTRQIVFDALTWAMEKPETLTYHSLNRELQLWISPNIVGFQWVMHGIGARAEKQAAKQVTITVDQQTQFNKGQRSLAEFYASIRDIPLVNGPGLPPLDFSKMPTTPLRFASHREAVGLELVDVYLWLFKKIHQQDRIAHELKPLIDRQLRRGRTDQLSIDAIIRRWEPYFRERIDADFTDEDMARAREIYVIDEQRRMEAMAAAGVRGWNQREPTDD